MKARQEVDCQLAPWCSRLIHYINDYVLRNFQLYLNLWFHFLSSMGSVSNHILGTNLAS
jgi:hypothetical protein